MPTDPQKEWEQYRERELAQLEPILVKLGFVLDTDQPHTQGERYLMQAVTTAAGRKLILLGRRINDGKRVVIKASRDANGMREIERERVSRDTLKEINFAYQAFLSPEELLFTRESGYAIAIQAFVEQDQAFLARPRKEQFALALKAFKAQESARATTYGHERLIKKTFGAYGAVEYLESFMQFKNNILAHMPETDVRGLLEQGQKFLEENREIIEQYGSFLTHTDFVPHNFRVVGSDIYLLDHSSLRFGNKYEGWARFINFMELYHPELARALVDYVRLNRTPEESVALKAMRIYRLGEIIWYYVDKLPKSTGDLCTLNEARVRFWAEILKNVLADTQPPTTLIETYRATRDRLRSPEEKARQQNLH